MCGEFRSNKRPAWLEQGEGGSEKWGQFRVVLGRGFGPRTQCASTCYEQCSVNVSLLT
jgi:hypothetical protein